jgi:hypothetical protein
MQTTSAAPEALPAKWRERAEYLRAFGDSNCAKLWEIAATELEQSLTAHGQEALTLTEAAKVSGFTADHLGQLVKAGKLANAGREGAPRIRRSDLPMKKVGGPGRPPSRAQSQTPAVDAERESIRSVAASFNKRRR